MRRIAPPTDRAGVIRGGRGSDCAFSTAEVVPFVVVLPCPVGVGNGVDAMASEKVEDGRLEVATEVEFLLSEGTDVLVAGGIALLEESCGREVAVLDMESDCEPDVKVGKAELLLSCLISSTLLLE